MLMFEIDQKVMEESARLTPAVLQIAEMLGMYHAELARVLKLHCADIGRLAAAQELIKQDTVAWKQAMLFVRFYQALYRMKAGNEIAIYNWMRVENKQLEGVPLLLMVDKNRLEDVLTHIENTMNKVNGKLDT